MKALVTGASSGIGKATALLLARRGFEVLMVARRPERFEKILAENPDVAKSLRTDTLDVSKVDDIARFAERQKAWLRDLDLLVNNAGLAKGSDPLDVNFEEDVVQVIETNVIGLLALTRRILPFMRARRSGHVINLGSVAGDAAYRGGTVYCASKAAVHMITDCLRLDLGGTGVRVSTVAPGRVADTEFSEVRFEGDRAKAAKVYEGYRVMPASEVAEAIAWIALRPAHVNIQELVILPTDQPSATTLEPLSPAR